MLLCEPIHVSLRRLRRRVGESRTLRCETEPHGRLETDHEGGIHMFGMSIQSVPMDFGQTQDRVGMAMGHVKSELVVSMADARHDETRAVLHQRMGTDAA